MFSPQKYRFCFGGPFLKTCFMVWERGCWLMMVTNVCVSVFSLLYRVVMVELRFVLLRVVLLRVVWLID